MIWLVDEYAMSKLLKKCISQMDSSEKAKKLKKSPEFEKLSINTRSLIFGRLLEKSGLTLTTQPALLIPCVLLQAKNERHQRHQHHQESRDDHHRHHHGAVVLEERRRLLHGDHPGPVHRFVLLLLPSRVETNQKGGEGGRGGRWKPARCQ
ncbi:unnamed protein product [Caenorhabditis nigoni]